MVAQSLLCVPRCPSNSPFLCVMPSTLHCHYESVLKCYHNQAMSSFRKKCLILPSPRLQSLTEGQEHGRCFDNVVLMNSGEATNLSNSQSNAYQIKKIWIPNWIWKHWADFTRRSHAKRCHRNLILSIRFELATIIENHARYYILN